jgi:hypothetical protein
VNVHYLVKSKAEHLKNMEYVADQGEAYIASESDWGGLSLRRRMKRPCAKTS